MNLKARKRHPRSTDFSRKARLMEFSKGLMQIKQKSKTAVLSPLINTLADWFSPIP